MIQFIMACLIAGTITFWFFAAVGRFVAGPIRSTEKPFFYRRVFRFTVWVWGFILVVGTVIAMGFWGLVAITLFFSIKSMVVSSPTYDEPKNWNITVK